MIRIASGSDVTHCGIAVRVYPKYGGSRVYLLESIIGHGLHIRPLSRAGDFLWTPLESMNPFLVESSMHRLLGYDIKYSYKGLLLQLLRKTMGDRVFAWLSNDRMICSRAASWIIRQCREHRLGYKEIKQAPTPGELLQVCEDLLIDLDRSFTTIKITENHPRKINLR